MTTVLDKKKRKLGKQAVSSGINFKPLVTRDTIDLFSRIQAGHMGQWEYSEQEFAHDPVQGGKIWNQFLLEHPEYYIPEAEKILAQISSDWLPKHIIEPVSFAFLGIGSSQIFRQKDLELTKNFNNVSSAYIFDINRKYVTNGWATLEKISEWHGATLGGTVTDLFNEKRGFGFPQNFSFTEPKHLATMFGGTLLNIGGFVDDGPPARETIRRLELFRKAVGAGGFLAITQDANQNPEKIEAAYRHQTDFAVNLVHRINRDTPYEIDADSAEFTVQYHPKSHVLAHYLELVGTGMQGEKISGKYQFNNSYKIPEPVFIEWAEKAGFRRIQSEEHDGVYLHLLEASI